MNDHSPDSSLKAPSVRRPNVMLSCVAVLLVLLLAREGAGERQAMAQGANPSGGILNPADQRNQMIQELRRLNDRVERIQRTLDGAVKVEVLRMPESTPPR